MPNPNAKNPLTGRRYGWEAEQAAKKASDPDNIAKQLSMLERLAVAKKSYDDLMTFTQFTMPDPEDINNPHATRYEAAKFHKVVAKHLEEVERGEITQLIFCMPPRHGKTELATKRLAAWYSGRHPESDVIVAAAGDELASDFGGDVRAIMATPQYRLVFPQHKLRKGGSAKDNIQTVQGGRLIFAGRGGQINGRGAHLLLADDIFKDAEEARSQTIRDKAWDWFVKVALYRRMGKRLTIITMTRWHSDDIIGRLTDPENDHYNAEEAKGWKIIRLPGLAEEDDPLGRAPGEALWPEVRRDGSRYDVEYHMANQRRDPLGFAALTQQRPTVADGTLFRRENIQRYDPKDLPDNLRFYATSDHAVGLKQRNDPSCFGKAGVDQQGNLWFTELFWERVATDRAVEQMLSMGTGENAPLIWWAESGHISKSIGPFLNKRMVETERFINIREIVPSTDKQTRAQSIAARVAVGKVYIPKGPIWDKAVEEMLAFPNGTHDDFVDMLSLFGIGLQSQFGASAPTPKKAEPRVGSAAWLTQMDKWKKSRDERQAAGGF